MFQFGPIRSGLSQFGPIWFNVIQYDQKVVQCGPKVQFGLVFSHYDPICSKSGPVFPIMIQKCFNSPIYVIS